MCDKYCKPAKSVERQQFVCDSEGEKHCLPGWYDENSNCTTQVSEDACDGNPCLNGGTCSRMVGKNNIWCKCPSDFAGFLCEKCNNEYFCQNNGICVPRNGTKTCDCPIDYEGPLCEINVKHPCTEQRNPCKNGGACHSISDSASLCKCRHGYSGKTCNEKIRVDHCLEKFGNEAENPCTNNGTCIRQSNTFTCVCRSGVSGNYCETDIDECENYPCKDNERCVNTIGSYVCVMGIIGDENGTKIGDTESDKLIKELLSERMSKMMEIMKRKMMTQMMRKMMTQMMRKMMTQMMRKMMENKMREKESKSTTENDDKLERQKLDKTKGKSICTTVKCLNGGTCLDRGDTYRCQCAEGFRGRHCKKTQ